jgi:hypothetical protein
VSRPPSSEWLLTYYQIDKISKAIISGIGDKISSINAVEEIQAAPESTRLSAIRVNPLAWVAAEYGDRRVPSKALKPAHAGHRLRCATAGRNQRTISPPSIILARRSHCNADVHRGLDDLRRQPSADVVAKLAEPFCLGGGSVLDQRLVDDGLVERRVQQYRGRLDHQHVAGAPEVILNLGMLFSTK